MSVVAIHQLEDPPRPAARNWAGLVRASALPIAFAGVLSIPRLCSSLLSPPGQDHGLYQYITERVIAGDRLYVDVWDQNTPGIVGVHWLATKLCGHTILYLRIFDALWQALTLAYIVLLGGRDAKRWNVGWLAAILYALAYYGMGYLQPPRRGLRRTAAAAGRPRPGQRRPSPATQHALHLRPLRLRGLHALPGLLHQVAAGAGLWRDLAADAGPSLPSSL